MILLLFCVLELDDSLPMTMPETIPVAVSPWVGLEVDSVERRRFHLFPGVDDYVSAAFCWLPDSSCEVEVKAGTLPAVRYPVSAEQFRRIGCFIDRYEAVTQELAALPDGRSRYFELWDGIGPAPAFPDTTVQQPPRGSRWAGRLADGLTGAACGLGIGGAVGALRATKLLESRPESVLATACMSGEKYWYHYSVDIYELDRGSYAAHAGTGLALGSFAGLMLGRSHDRHTSASVVVDYDLFGDPIAESEVRGRMPSMNRIGWTAVGTLSGVVVGTGLGLLVTSIARNLIFRPNEWDTVIVRNDGFSLDLPLMAFALGGALQGVKKGYQRGWQEDRRVAIDAVKRRRLETRP